MKNLIAILCLFFCSCLGAPDRWSVEYGTGDGQLDSRKGGNYDVDSQWVAFGLSGAIGGLDEPLPVPPKPPEVVPPVEEKKACIDSPELPLVLPIPPSPAEDAIPKQEPPPLKGAPAEHECPSPWGMRAQGAAGVLLVVWALMLAWRRQLGRILLFERGGGKHNGS